MLLAIIYHVHHSLIAPRSMRTEYIDVKSPKYLLCQHKMYPVVIQRGVGLGRQAGKEHR